MHRLVIARYAECLDWLGGVPESFDIVIYNKGGELPAPRRGRVVARPNAGREGETFIAHIGDPGTAQAGYFTVFAQGDPFEHSPDFIGLLHTVDRWNDIQPLSWRWKSARNIPPAAILARDRGAFIGDLRIRPEIFSLSSWAPAGFDDPGAQWLNSTYRRLHGLPEGSNIAAHFLRLCGLADLAAAAEHHQLGRFAYGAAFAVRQENLAAVPPPALRRLGQACCAHDVYGYVLERLWLHMFGAPFLLPLEGQPAVGVSAADGGPASFHPAESAFDLRRRKVARAATRLKEIVGA